MGEFKPYPNYGEDFDREFIENARFTCKACGKDCRLDPGELRAAQNKMYAIGKCSECRRDQKFDVTHVWREE